MIALGVGTVWAGYYLFMYGYCLVRGYNVTIASMMHSTWPGAAATAAPAPASPGGAGGSLAPKAA